MKKIKYKTPELEVTRFDIKENIMEQVTPGDGDIFEVGTTRPYLSQVESTFEWDQ